MRRTWIFAASVMIFGLALVTRLPDGGFALTERTFPALREPSGVRV